MAQQQVESWDDDLDFGPANVFSQSLSTIKTSLSSRHSIRSESNAGEHEWQLPLSPGDEQSTAKAISSAKEAGIPLPQNITADALLGGSIKRLGKKTSRQDISDNWDEDLQLPQDPTAPLKVKTPQPQNHHDDDFDDWAEGSLGIRRAGTNADTKNRSSSASAMSPSMGSCMTFESEEDGLDGLIIPSGQLNFQAALKRKQDQVTKDEASQQPTSSVTQTRPRSNSQHDDFFADIDVGNGDVFDPKKRALNRNVKPTWKLANHSSPASKPQTTLTFTDKPSSTRLPRPISGAKPSRLEPVFETGATNITRPRNSFGNTSAQLIRTKRSMPALRSHAQAQSKAPSVPAVPAQPGYARPIARQSQFPGMRGSDPNRSGSPVPRPPSRSNAVPETPTKLRGVAPTSLTREAATKRTVTKPARRRNFGDGSELEMFDDLPTSATKESKFMKQPSTRPPLPALRNQTSLGRLGARDKMTTPVPTATPRSPTKPTTLPRFAQDTAASRIAREQKLGPASKRSDSVLSSRMNWPAQVAARTPSASPTAQRTKKKGPTLINPMGKENARHFQDDAARKGMRWNANNLCWEGNDHLLRPFSPPAQPSLSPPRPALITNFSGAGPQGIQVVGGMVFDPRQMRWLKMGRGAPSGQMSPSMDGDEEDPFKGIEDLEDGPVGGFAPGRPRAESSGAVLDTTGAQTSTANTGLEPVHEEFDLGPEFIRRQREEEGLWRTRAALWFPDGAAAERIAAGDGWKWAIRDIAASAGL